jgi:phosphatidylserine/phosphatidylglycerophosphate/cardiolipin synthase-like enzyme
MLPRRVLASISARSAATVLVTTTLALTGCKIETSGGDLSSGGASSDGTSSSGSAATSVPSGPSTAGSLIIEPNAGFSPVYTLIGHARSSIDLTMYELSDSTAEADLGAAAKRGVDVRVVLDHKEKSTNDQAYDYLRSHDVKVVWSSSKYEYTHQKTLVVDGSEAVIMTANLTTQYYATSRDFLVTDTSRPDVDAISAVFDADFAHHSVTPGDGQDLVWSPTDSQDKLLALINGARHSLRIYSEEMGDATIEKALIAAAKRGVDVQVCGENSDGEYDSDFKELAAGGVHVSYYSSSTGFYIHGKVVEADYGASGAKVFIGSENFSSTSLNDNRELGLITSNTSVMSAIASDFSTDFGRGQKVSS